MTPAVRRWVVRLVVSAAVLGILLTMLPAAELWAAMRQVPPARWAAVLGVFLAGHLVTAAKWRLLMGRRSDVGPALWLRAHFAGLVANLCLPGVAGGDVVRAGLVMRRVADRSEGVALASVVDRIIDTGALLLLALVGAAWAGARIEAARPALYAACVLAVVGLVAAIALAAWLVPRRDRGGLVGRLASAVAVLVRSPELPAVALVLSLGVQSLFIVSSAWLGEAAGVDVGLAAWFVAWPLAKLTSMVPVSLGGLGVREAALVAFLAPFGAAPAGVMASGLLWQAVLATSGIAGWLVLQLVPDAAAHAHAGGARIA